MNAPELSEEVLELAFMVGLKSKIRAGVKMFEPRGLQKMMEMAKKVEDWSAEEEPASGKGSKPNNGAQSGVSTKPSYGGFGSNKPKTVPAQTNPSTKVTTGKGTTTHGRLKPPFRRLTPEEVAKWIAEGLCFKCDEKFHRNHLCAKPELTVLVTHANGTETELTEEPREVMEEEVADEVEAVVAEVSINSVVGLTSPRTMKLRGRIGG